MDINASHVGSAGRLIVFTRALRLGEVKTRLASVIGAQPALDVYLSLLERTLVTVTRFSEQAAEFELQLCNAGQDIDGALAGRAQRAQMTLAAQCDGDLGRRMADALNRSLADGLPAVLIGSDCPTLEPRHLHWAFASLAHVDAVFLPAEDGGYALVGLRRSAAGIFAGIDWSTDRVMQQTRDRLLLAGLSWREGERLWDVDTIDDLKRWRTLTENQDNRDNRDNWDNWPATGSCIRPAPP